MCVVTKHHYDSGKKRLFLSVAHKKSRSRAAFIEYLVVPYLAKLMARVSRITVILICPG